MNTYLPKPEIQKLESLFELAAVLGQQKDFQESLRIVAQAAANLLEAESASVMMMNPMTRQTIKTIFRNRKKVQDPIQHKINTHVSGWVVKNRQPFFSEDLQADGRFSKRLFRDLHGVTVHGTPLWAEGLVIGVLVLARRRFPVNDRKKDSYRTTLNMDDPSYLEKFAAVVAPFLRNVQKIQLYFAPPIREDALLQRYAEIGLLGRSKQFIELLHAVESASLCDVRVLLEGKSGTGKERIAYAIHQFSARKKAPFIAIDCGAIPVNIIESELFGHIKGAFTGAISNRNGLIAEADKGTLFMDEIANLPTDIQAKLMRFLQEGQIRPVGCDKIRKVDVRIIAAGSISLRKLVEAGKFREDLYYRLHVYPIQVPSLTERQKDIPILANHFLAEFVTQQNKKAQAFHEEIIDFMQQRQWIGNIRELENFVERLVTLAPATHRILGRSILPKDLLKEFKKVEVILQDRHVTQSLNESIAEFEEGVIRQVLVNNTWNQAKTARQLKISPETLRHKMKKLGIFRGDNR